MKTLFEAVTRGDLGEVRRLVEADPSLVGARDHDNFGATVINAAVQRRDREMIDLLLELSADINAKSDWEPGGFTSLMIVPWDALEELGQYLVQRGACVDVHAAARLGDTLRLTKLLNADPAKIHARGGDGQTPLHLVAS